MDHHNCNCCAHACPCCSGLDYTECCKLFHQGKQPENALELMKSRYAAYAMNVPEYIVETTHPTSPEYTDNKFSWKRKISLFSTHYAFHKLEIHDFKENGLFASVTFTAHISLRDEDQTYTETSYFEKLNGRWFYRNGKATQGTVEQHSIPEKLDLLPFTYLGNPILRRKAEPVETITDEIKELVGKMVQCLEAGNGVGIAAPQVNQSLRLFLVKMPIQNEDGSTSFGELKVVINPKFSNPAKDKASASEGCLSIPGFRANVERPTEIDVEYTTLEGEKVTTRLVGYEARIFMHENDHINGVLFIDRLDAKAKAEAAPFLQQLEKRLEKVI